MMKKLLYAIVILPLFGYGQIFQENWDGSGPGITAWTLINVDGLTPASGVSYVNAAWITRDRGGATPNFGGPDGNFAAMSTSWYSPAGTANDWLVSPTINLTAAPSAFLSWDAKAQDAEYPDGYSVKLAPNGGNTVADFTVNLYTTAGENPTWTTRSVNISAYIGQNVRIAFVNNSNDAYVLLVDNISVTTAEVEIPVTYCASTYLFVEAISNVNFAGINNPSDPADDVNEYQDFTTVTGTVQQGQTYPITLKGNTGGNYTDYFTVYIDWNQNGTLDDAGEAYQIGSILNSTGSDAVQATGNILVPATALLGNTRMRVVKYYDEYTGTPCTSSDDFSFGQTEDYTLTVTASPLSIGTFDADAFSYYPNPVKNYLNLKYKDAIENVAVYNMIGQEVLRQNPGTSTAQIDVTSLPIGTYIVKATIGSSVNTIKIVKQ